jgi:hypothetical protein
VKRFWLAALALPLAACGIQPSGVTDAGQGPTGVAPGTTLYFVDAHEQLRPQLRGSNLGTITDALALLLSGGPNDPDLHTEIRPEGVTRVGVATTPGLIQLTLPLAAREVTPLGIDQIVCTALGVYVQGGGSKATKVQLWFTEPTADSDRPRTCPVIR